MEVKVEKQANNVKISIEMNWVGLAILVQNKSTKTLGSFHLSNSNFQISFGEGIVREE